MHELAITQSVVDTVVERTAGRRVQTVRLAIGRLSGVVPDAVEFCYELVTAGTPMAGSTLEIERVPGRGHCRSCESDVDLDDLILLCPCGSADVHVLAGRELRIVSVQLEVQPCA